MPAKTQTLTFIWNSQMTNPKRLDGTELYSNKVPNKEKEKHCITGKSNMKQKIKRLGVRHAECETCTYKSRWWETCTEFIPVNSSRHHDRLNKWWRANISCIPSAEMLSHPRSSRSCASHNMTIEFKGSYSQTSKATKINCHLIKLTKQSKITINSDEDQLGENIMLIIRKQIKS